MGDAYECEDLSRRRSGVLLGLLGLLVLLGLVYGPALVSRGPWNPDEPRYCEVAREMAVTGEVLVPHLNGEVYGEKPPLFFALAAAAGRATGSYVLGGRLVSLLAVMLVCAVLVALGRTLFGEARTGLLAAALYATSLLPLLDGQRAALDPLLAALVLVAVWALLEVRRRGCLWVRLGLAGLGGIALGGAVLTKGPVGVLAAVLGVLALGWAGAGVAWLALGGALALAAGIGLGWLWAAAQHAGAWYWDRMLWEQTAGRAVESWSHRQPVYYYLLQLPWGAAPWIALLPAAVVALGGRGPASGGASGAGAPGEPSPAGAGRRAAWGLFLWAAAGLLIMSAVSGKRASYLLPYYPALALVLAWAVRAGALACPRWWGRGMLALLVAAVGIAGAALLVLPGLHALLHESGRLPAVARLVASHLPAFWSPAALGGGASLLALAWAAARALRAGRPAAVVLCTAAAVALGSALAHATIVPALDPLRSFEPFAREVAARWERSEPLVLLHDEADGRLNFYLGTLHHEVVLPEALQARLEQPDRLWVVGRRGHLQDVPPPVRARLQELYARAVGSKEYVLLREEVR
ncbi:MAG: hypothetical protein KatS3mg102_2122 [Planctomycetota bacterium]|nr:MAG: hypothetical protein KatS3mg102_2122 [Planctomycetota bacterium]